MASEPAPVALLDRSFCRALIATRAGTLKQALRAHEPGTLGISALTVAALYRRAAATLESARNRRALDQFLLPLQVVDFGADAAHSLASLEWSAVEGQAPSSEARLVAAQALSIDAAVLTCAPQEYAGLPGVRLRVFDVDALPSHAEPLDPPPSLILAMGSHDLTLDLLGERLHAAEPSLVFCSAHVGSMEGLLALRRGDAHLAGAHLLDEETGDYNVAHVRRLLGEQGVHAVVVAFVTRTQGMIVARGNPKAIHALDDLARDDIRFANRQPGAGTRVLIDFTLKRTGLASAAIDGYTHELNSHTAVAAAVASGAADCGMGILAAAHAHGLDFVPLFEERYDLVIPTAHYESARLAPLRKALQRPETELLRAVQALGGYTADQMGRVLAEC